eukprot:TRINITY_DN8569_c0_g1_i1.p1 TRINITY_DN8569_c0_g1~~TRINITY_DN8569_c0_g1_i1.p1  ORF type:complete len:411 (-),score=151.15 TRINITY_DN8569_c0_g1_i1:479-1711(-)
MSSLSRIPVRHMVSKAFRDPNFVRKAPFPYLTRNYNPFWQLIDKTTLRWDENTKLIMLEGPCSPEKSELAKRLASEFGMVHMPSPSVDDFFFRTQNNGDFRIHNEHFLPRNQPFAEPEFFANPMGFARGGSDRYIFMDYMVKFTNYVYAMRHMFNTGEGVVVEGNPFSAFTRLDAALRSKYIDPSTKRFFTYASKVKHRDLLRPNLILHLDVDTPKASSLLKAKYEGGPIAAKNPVWGNYNYLSDLSSSLKRDYLNDAKKHSHVLVYDWNEPGEHDIIVEDIERLNLDLYDIGDTQQQDWFLQMEDEYEAIRMKVSGASHLRHLLNFGTLTDSVDAEHLLRSAEEVINMDKVLDSLDSERFARGWNPHNGINVFTKSSSSFVNIRPLFYSKISVGSTHTEGYIYPKEASN